MARYVMALDQGTTSSRAVLYDRAGRIVATDQYEFPQHFPQPGWVEHDAGEIWDSQLRAARGALEKAGAQGGDLAAIGITNQRETAVVWDRATGEPIHPAIVPHRPRHRRLLLRHQGALHPRRRPGRPGARRARRARLRHRRLVAAPPPHRWPGPRHRVLECLANVALQHPRARLGRAPARGAARSTRDAARGPRHQRRLRLHRPGVVRRGDPDRGNGGRPAGGALRPGLQRFWPGEWPGRRCSGCATGSV
jgi:hypothetical protein